MTPAESTAAESTVDARQRVLKLLKLYGWNATSFQILEPGFRYWFDGPDACVAYVEVGRAWIAAGSPVASRDRIGEVTQRFLAAAHAVGRRASFFAAAARMREAGVLDTLHIGEQPVWNPRHWVHMSASHPNMRQQLRRAQAKGVTVRLLSVDEVRSPDAPMRRELDTLIERWLHARVLPPMGFLVSVQPFALCDERRYWVAEHAGRLVGFLAAAPVYSRGGWLFENFLRDPTAPNGTTELLIDAGMRNVAAEGCTYATLGLSPLAGVGSKRLRLARRMGAALYDFGGLAAFKAKLRPHGWERIYLGHAPGSSGNLALYDALAAFANGSFVRFGGTTLLRGPAVVVRLLAALLVPWTVVLASAGPRWFPAPWVQQSWIAFDVSLIVALFALAFRWRDWLATVLALAISADAAVTFAQVVAWDAGRVRGALGALMLVISVCGPLLASVVLWGALGHRQRRPELPASATPGH